MDNEDQLQPRRRAMDSDIVQLKIDMGVLIERIRGIQVTLDNQDAIIKTQTDQIAQLVSLADQGRGSIWMLLAVGGVVGAIISNAKSILKFFS